MGDRKPKKNSSGSGDAHKAKVAKRMLNGRPLSLDRMINLRIRGRARKSRALAASRAAVVSILLCVAG